MLGGLLLGMLMLFVVTVLTVLMLGSVMPPLFPSLPKCSVQLDVGILKGMLRRHEGDAQLVLFLLALQFNALLLTAKAFKGLLGPDAGFLKGQFLGG